MTHAYMNTHSQAFVMCANRCTLGRGIFSSFSFILLLLCNCFIYSFSPAGHFAFHVWAGTGITILPPFKAHLHPCLHDTFSPQEKPWARTGRKTLENQDTIWHLWSLNDFLLGVGFCPTGKSQKTGRENYIRENVYATHSAPSLFAPEMSDYSSTLNLWEGRGGWWREGDSFHH